jgi:hypothetical protein
MLLAASIIQDSKCTNSNHSNAIQDPSKKRYTRQITAWASLVGRFPSSASAFSSFPLLSSPLLSTAAARATHLIVILARSSSPAPPPPPSPPLPTWLRKVSDLVSFLSMPSFLFSSFLFCYRRVRDLQPRNEVIEQLKTN